MGRLPQQVGAGAPGRLQSGAVLMTYVLEHTGTYLEWCTDHVDARQGVGNKVALQGNLDPMLL